MKSYYQIEQQINEMLEDIQYLKLAVFTIHNEPEVVEEQKVEI